MKKLILLAMVAALALAAFACAAPAATGETQDTVQAVQSQAEEAVQSQDAGLTQDGFGSAGAAVNENPTLEEMLNYAIQDEYMARAEYEAIITQYGNATPFTNIIGAEESHISQLLPLFEAYGFDPPADDAASRTVLPASLQEAYETGVDAEIANIAMYESFLAQDIPADVSAVFQNLLSGSESHLRAFENAAEGNTGSGSGAGNGAGNGLRDGSGSAAS